ncbi:MAG: hypothetical protein IPP21_10380 [Betaproteobacteria bacterium]|nr:hypothetical protein [Betaproteobacteria bacterium]
MSKTDKASPPDPTQNPLRILRSFYPPEAATCLGLDLVESGDHDFLLSGLCARCYVLEDGRP